MSQQRVRIAGVQMDVLFGGIQDNLEKMQRRLQEAVGQGAKLVVFPECAVTGYCCETRPEACTLADPIPGPIVDQMAAAAAKHDCYVVFGMLEQEGADLYNASVLLGPNGLIGVYRKTHLPSLGVDKLTTPGKERYRCFDAPPMRIGMNICYDVAFPEASRALALDGADLIVLPTNWPPGAELMAEHVINTRALENHIYYAAVNRVGVERGFEFIGRSRICDPHGNTLCQGPPDQEIILYADIDVSLVRNKHIVRVPGKHEIHRMKDRRPDLYG